VTIEYDTAEEWDLADALFLRNHPGWTWQALQDTPEPVVAILQDLERRIAERDARK